MRNVPSLLAMLDADQPAPRPVVMPWDYVRLRRTAVNKSIEQVAKPYWTSPEHKADVERNIRRLETVGFRLQEHYFAADLSRSMTFSVDVYRQLCDLPPHQHPRLCLACGWDQWTVAYDSFNQDVTWSDQDPDICTRCEQLGTAKVIG